MLNDLSTKDVRRQTTRIIIKPLVREKPKEPLPVMLARVKVIHGR